MKLIKTMLTFHSFKMYKLQYCAKLTLSVIYYQLPMQSFQAEVIVYSILYLCWFVFMFFSCVYMLSENICDTFGGPWW